jgi:hypothetical protein
MKRSPHKTIHIKRATLVQLFDSPVVRKKDRFTSLADWRYERELFKLSIRRPNRLRVGLVRASTGNPFFFNGAHVGAEND